MQISYEDLKRVGITYLEWKWIKRTEWDGTLRFELIVLSLHLCCVTYFFLVSFVQHSNSHGLKMVFQQGEMMQQWKIQRRKILVWIFFCKVYVRNCAKELLRMEIFVTQMLAQCSNISILSIDQFCLNLKVYYFVVQCLFSPLFCSFVSF